MAEAAEEAQAAEGQDGPNWRGKWFALLHAKLGVQSTDLTGDKVREERCRGCRAFDSGYSFWSRYFEYYF